MVYIKKAFKTDHMALQISILLVFKAGHRHGRLFLSLVTKSALALGGE